MDQANQALFIQAFMFKKVFNVEELYQLHRKCCNDAQVSGSQLKELIKRTNANILPMDMAIKKASDELDGKDYYILVNLVDNKLSKLLIGFKNQEIELFKLIIGYIVESDDGKTPLTRVVNSATEVKLNKKEVNEAIQKFKEKGWICINAGDIFFSTRAITELTHLLKKKYENSINHCFLCKNIVLQGSTCKSCDKRMHFHCVETYFARFPNICPECKKSFNNEEENMDVA